jgi:hypothetical protein
MADLEVDIAGLESLVGSLASVREGLDDTRDVVDASESAMGSSEVSGALRDFEDHWRDGRGVLKENLEAVVSAVEESAAAYRAADDELAASLQEESS